MAFHEAKKDWALGKAGREGNAYAVQQLKEFLRMFASRGHKAAGAGLRPLARSTAQRIDGLPLPYTNLAGPHR